MLAATRLLLVFGVGFSLCSPAFAIKLMCEGVWPAYQDGIGSTEINWKEKSSRLIELDQVKQIARTMTLFGERTAKLSSNDEFFWFSLDTGTTYKGRHIEREDISINRYTGSIFGRYIEHGREAATNTPMSFSGTCKVAERVF